MGHTDVLTRLAEAQAVDGATREALDTMELALKTNPEELVFRPDAIRYRGALRLKVGQNQAAEADFSRRDFDGAKGCARGYGNCGQRSAWCSSGAIKAEDSRAHDLLASVYDRFIEGFNTLDLQDCKALLDQLA